MPKVTHYTLHAVDLPFRGAFEHAASKREASSSLFLELRLDDGTSGWGESLPRTYVTGESQESAAILLRERILPRLIGRSFSNMNDVRDFLTDCDGRAPADWVSAGERQSAAWCSVDLALLDAFGRTFNERPLGDHPVPDSLRYSGVLSSRLGWKHKAQLLAYRLLGFPAIKIKIDDRTDGPMIEKIRRYSGGRIALRGDVNMGWSVSQARERMPFLARHGLDSFEQPLAADDLDGAAELVSTTGLDVMADESLNTRESLDALIEKQACTAINARISKCGGLVATLARCREAQAAGLWVQVGCQVGESSLLSAAHIHLCSAFAGIRHAEGCFGTHLLREDPAAPMLRFSAGGHPPELPDRPGIGVDMDTALLAKYRSAAWEGPSS